MAKIFSVTVKSATVRLFDPLIRALLRIGVTANVVTVIGTLGVGVGALGFATRGHLVAAVVIVTLSALTDVIDGAVARAQGKPGKFGALLDSTLDRVADGMVFAALAYFYRHETPTLVAVLICLVAGQVVSYVKARAEGLGLDANVGLVERSERLISIGVGALLTAAGVGWGLPAALWLLAAGSIFTVGQRMAQAARSDRQQLAEQQDTA
ncbi:MAG: CDP-alcohol phosphatidyltransferase family protein [Hamadaea sp.]|uniref:phosphatidylinositol phosphate synthase n=1 Tax=Hamadaea sp. TaxID=2024425 RepID=UPI0017D9EBCB|nr:CDP-alcohol phosphatidyltransferase family protein [Hamadaea sp.]NUR69828.1 CDP-alcohol phosphatidyltransferase family protein [Hamadaea sp.]NUT19192.1 CDP-alcohol phosphatidyltransferase family protein [Hamadaea sp.]